MTDLIEHHLDWLRPRTRTAQTTADPPTINKRRRLLRHANAHLPYGVERAAEEEIAAYLGQWDGWTRYTYDTGLRSFYHWAIQRGYLACDPMAELPKPDQGDTIPHPCTDGELALAMTAGEPYGLAIRLAAYLGLRCGEIARAQRSHVRGERLRVVGKGGRIRTVPIQAQVRDLVLGAHGPLIGRHVNEDTLSARQRPAWDALGLTRDFRLHSGRHWYATRLLEAGATLREVQVLLGHSSPTTTAGYTQVTDERMALAVDRLPRVGQDEPDCGRLVLVPAA